MASSFRRFVGRVAVGVLAVAVPVVITPVAASAAAPTDLFFSEYVEGTSNNKALEIYNGTGAAVDLAAGGYNVQVFANGARRPDSTIALTGSVAAGDVCVMANPSASATILAQARRRPAGRSASTATTRSTLRKGDDGRPRRHRAGRLRPGRGVGRRARRSTADNTLRRKADRLRGRRRRIRCLRPGGAVGRLRAVDTFDGLGAHTTTCGSEPPADEAPSVTG